MVQSDKSDKSAEQVLAKELEQDMLKLYESPIISDKTLQKALGYSSLDALRQAILRKHVAIPVFSIQKRRGKFALVKDVALHLAKERCSIMDNKKEADHD